MTARPGAGFGRFNGQQQQQNNAINAMEDENGLLEPPVGKMPENKAIYPGTTYLILVDSLLF